MTAQEVRRKWYDALGEIYDARYSLYKALNEQVCETEAEREELEELLAMSDKLVAMYESDGEEAED